MMDLLRMEKWTKKEYNIVFMEKYFIKGNLKMINGKDKGNYIIIMDNYFIKDNFNKIQYAAKALNLMKMDL